jgi:hypothetical protein
MVHMHKARHPLAQKLLKACLDFRVPHLGVMIEEQVVALQPMHNQPVDFTFGDRDLWSRVLRTRQDFNLYAPRSLSLSKVQCIGLRPTAALWRKLVDHVQDIHRHKYHPSLPDDNQLKGVQNESRRSDANRD